MGFFDTHIKTPLVVEQNEFLYRRPETTPLPVYEDVKDGLPKPKWDGHDAEIACYWKAWEIAFRHLRNPVPKSGFVSNFIDSAFNGHLYMWDSAFIMLFAKYGNQIYNFQRTLDNFYSCQHLDGYICREIDEITGEDQFERFDPTGTGPNMIPWAEWEYFLNFGDRERLRLIFPPLLAYHRWLKSHRTWPDGSYFASGFASGMDNQPRQDEGYHTHFSHGHMSWIDMCAQQVLSARILLRIGEIIGRSEELDDLRSEIEHLVHYMNEHMWDEGSGFYYDRRPNGGVSGVKTVGAFWTLLADAVPDNRAERLIAHLEDERSFKRPHRVPSLAADHPKYDPEGDYWVGSVWPPTNYMVLRSLTMTGEDKLAHEIGRNHLDQVVQVFEETGTLWENYAPERAAKGSASKPDFVGWTGLPPIAVLFEYVFGIRANVPDRTLVWDVRLLEEHGIEQYPFGVDGQLNLLCGARNSLSERPNLRIESNVDLTLLLKWDGGEEKIRIMKKKD